MKWETDDNGICLYYELDDELLDIVRNDIRAHRGHLFFLDRGSQKVLVASLDSFSVLPEFGSPEYQLSPFGIELISNTTDKCSTQQQCSG